MSITTIGDWLRQPDFRMMWSIYNDEDEAAHDHFCSRLYAQVESGALTEREADQWSSAAYRNIRLDLSAPAGVPDGVHTVFHVAGYGASLATGNAHGVVICNGQFEPQSTQQAVYAAVCRSCGVPESRYRNSPEPEVHHVFIESFIWHPDRNRLQVHTGS